MQLNAGDVLRIKQWMRSCGLRMVFLGLALGLCFTNLALAASTSTAPTQTALTVSSDNTGPRTKANLTAHVSAAGGESAIPAGVVDFRSGNIDLGSAVIDGEGNAVLTTDNLAAGAHQVVADYQGDSTHEQSISASAQVDAQASNVAGYTISAAPTALSVAAGAFASSTITVTPVNGFNAYVSLSCSELPPATSCSFSPVNVLASCTAGAGQQQTCTPGLSTIQLQTIAPSGTQAPTGAQIKNPSKPHSSLPAYAFAFPALFAGLAGLRTRNHRAIWNTLIVLSLLAGALGMTACKERYNYLNHGPTPNPGTPSGTYTITVNSVSTTGSLITMPPTSPQLALTVTAPK